MEDENVKVTVKIGQRPLTVIIKKEWEHFFLEAEKVINDSFFDFAKKWQYKDQQDLTNMVLLDFVVKALADKERLREYDEELVPMMESLKQLTEQFPIDYSFFDRKISRISSDTFVKLNRITNEGDACHA